MAPARKGPYWNYANTATQSLPKGTGTKFSRYSQAFLYDTGGSFTRTQLAIRFRNPSKVRGQRLFIIFVVQDLLQREVNGEPEDQIQIQDEEKDGDRDTCDGGLKERRNHEIILASSSLSICFISYR